MILLGRYDFLMCTRSRMLPPLEEQADDFNVSTDY
jgi:hypothetical protein